MWSVNLTTLFLGKPPRQLPIFFVTKYPQKNVPGLRIEPATLRIRGGHASDQATAPGISGNVDVWQLQLPDGTASIDETA